MAKKTTIQVRSTDTNKLLLSVIVFLSSLIILGVGFFLGKTHDTVSHLTPTVFPDSTSTESEINQTPTTVASLPNPASAFCVKQGGTLSIKTRGDGGQYGLCEFEDGYACEEWAMYRDECPVGGVRTTGFDTVQQKYCAWSGGSTLAEKRATCTFPDGTVCSDEAFYNGTCSKKNN